MKEEYIDQNKCNDFELFMLYIMSYLKEDDLNEDMKDVNYMMLGEMERYSRFGIEWEKCKLINDLVMLPEHDDRWQLENKFQEVAQKAHELYNYMKDNNFISDKEKMTSDVPRYSVSEPN